MLVAPSARSAVIGWLREVRSLPPRRRDPSFCEVAAWADEAELVLFAGALPRLAYHLNVLQSTMRHGRTDVRLRIIRDLWSNVSAELPSS